MFITEPWIVSMAPNMITRSCAATSASVRPAAGSFAICDVIDASARARLRSSSACRIRSRSSRAASASRCGSGLPS